MQADSHTCSQYNTKYRGLASCLVKRVSGVDVLLVCSSTTDRELRASGQPSHWPDTTSRGDGRHDASLAASASYRETLPMWLWLSYHPLESIISNRPYVKTAKHLNTIGTCLCRSISIVVAFKKSLGHLPTPLSVVYTYCRVSRVRVRGSKWKDNPRYLLQHRIYEDNTKYTELECSQNDFDVDEDAPNRRCHGVTIIAKFQATRVGKLRSRLTISTTVPGNQPSQITSFITRILASLPWDNSIRNA